MQRPPAEPKSPVRLLTDERGDTGMIEFLLAFPIFLTLLCLVGQLALLFVGQLVVEYAAFNAARSAIVHIPVAVDASGTDTFNRLDDEKREKIERSAEVSCAIVSPGIPIGLQLAKTAGVTNRSLDTGDVLFSGLWSQFLTSTRLLDERGEELSASHRFGEHEPVTVEVTHEFVLNVPIAATIFSDGSTSNDLPGTGLLTRALTARATLLNQGRPQGIDE